jgi:hypothetical protein
MYEYSARYFYVNSALLIDKVIKAEPIYVSVDELDSFDPEQDPSGKDLSARPSTSRRLSREAGFLTRQPTSNRIVVYIQNMV